MFQASELRNNTTFVYQDEPWKVLEYKHTHMGRGSADVRVKIRNLLTGVVRSQVFAPTERFDEADIQKQPRQYLYREGDNLVFMHPTTFEQETIAAGIIGELAAKFLKEGEEVSVFYWGEKAIDIDMPPKATLTVAEADPGVKGNSATNIYKSAKLENGVVVKVPLFVRVGDKVKVDTRTGEYAERVN
ncbi:elongation factor P [Candidatus Beckwithbacteria bacterium RBG_13_42_9]|uniref:Elongation factor P n=1 Tax=Candidatus Beckwithbacteria bacterium RBG_13_42_9 TaxID=1797457 RepID=A0A1F5E5K8_9BACT|nr:MAG: elongation factor P [Candidatus Beckwithbacteria bacterium RBG_13_42_9]